MSNQPSNVTRLVIHKMSIDAIPPGGGLADGIAFLSDKAKIAEGWRAAEAWVREAIQMVRQAADPNPWRAADDEAIAGELLRLIAEREGHPPGRA